MYDELEEMMLQRGEYVTPDDLGFVEDIPIQTSIKDIPGVNIEEKFIEAEFDMGEREELTTPPKEEIKEEDLSFFDEPKKEVKNKQRKDNYRATFLKDQNINNLFVGLNNVSFSIKDINEVMKANAYANVPYYDEEEVKETIKKTLNSVAKKSYEIDTLDIDKKVELMLKPIDNNPQLKAIMEGLRYDTSFSILSYDIEIIRDIAQKIGKEYEDKKVEKVLYDFMKEVVLVKQNLLQTPFKEYKPFYGKHENEIDGRRYYNDELLFIHSEDYELLSKNKNYDIRFREGSYRIIDLNTDEVVKDVNVINKTLEAYKADMLDNLDTHTKDKYEDLLEFGKLVKDTPIIVNNEYINSEDIKYATDLTIEDKKNGVEVNFVDALNNEKILLDENLHEMLYKALEERYFDEKQRNYWFNKYKKFFTANGLMTMEFFDNKLKEIKESEYLLKNSVDNELIHIAKYYDLLSESEEELLRELKKEILDTNEELYTLLETYVKDSNNPYVKELKAKEEATFEMATNIRKIHDNLSESNDNDYLSKERLKVLSGEFGISDEFLEKVLEKSDVKGADDQVSTILNSPSVNSYQALQSKLSKIDYREKFAKSFHNFSDTPYVLYADRLKEIFAKYNQIQVEIAKSNKKENKLLVLSPEKQEYINKIDEMFKIGQGNGFVNEFKAGNIKNVFFDIGNIQKSFINEYKDKFNIKVANIESTPQFKEFVKEKLKELEEFIGENENKLDLFEEKLNKAKLSISLKNADEKNDIEDKKKILRGEVNDYFSTSNALTEDVIQNLELDEEKKDEIDKLHEKVELLRIEKRRFSLEKIDEIEELFENTKKMKDKTFDKAMKDKNNLIVLPIFSVKEDTMVNLFIQEKELNPLYEAFKEVEYGDKKELLKLLNNKNAKMIEIDDKSVAIEVDDKSFIVPLPAKKDIKIKDKENSYIDFEDFHRLLIKNDVALEKFLKEKEQYKVAINRHISDQLREIQKPDPLISNEGLFSLVSFFSDTKKLLNNLYIGVKAVANISLFMKAHLHSPREQYKNAKRNFLDTQNKLLKDSKELQKELEEFYEKKENLTSEELKIYLENKIETSNLARYAFGIKKDDDNDKIQEKIKQTNELQIIEKVNKLNDLLNSNKTIEIKDEKGQFHSIKSLNTTKEDFIRSIRLEPSAEKIDIKTLFNKTKDKTKYLYELTKSNYTSFEEYKEKRALTKQNFTTMFANEVSLYDKSLKAKYVIEPMAHLDEDKLLEARELLLAIKYYQNQKDYPQANQLKNKFFYMFNVHKTVIEDEDILKEIYKNVEEDLIKYKIYDYAEFKESLEKNVRNDVLDPIRKNLNKHLLKAELTETDKARMFQLLIKEIDKIETIQLQTMRENTEYALTIQNISNDVKNKKKKSRYRDRLLNLELANKRKEKEERIKEIVSNILEKNTQPQQESHIQETQEIQQEIQEEVKEIQQEEVEENQADFLSL